MYTEVLVLLKQLPRQTVQSWVE